MRLLYVTYGHHGHRGYDYLTEKQYKSGDVVVVPVEHYKSHKLYNTLAIVEKTYDSESKPAQKIIKFDEGNRGKDGRFKKRVKIKTISQRFEVARSMGLDVKDDHAVGIRTLPGYSTRLSDDQWHSSKRMISRGGDEDV